MDNDINDPLIGMERAVRQVHDRAGRYTQPVLRRYPLLFTFLIVFSAAAIMEGFKMLVDQIPIFDQHPSLLLFIGVIALLVTGTLYKVLEKMK